MCDRAGILALYGLYLAKALGKSLLQENLSAVRAIDLTYSSLK
jgi:hypothetical protein